MITSSEPLNPVVWEQIKHLDGQTLTVDNTVYRLHRIPELGLAIATGHPRYRCRKIPPPAGAVASPRPVYQSADLILLLRLLRTLRSPRYGMLDALHSDAIRVHYQPIVSLKEGKIVGAEALARWQQPDGSFYRRIFLFRLPKRPGSLPI